MVSFSWREFLWALLENIEDSHKDNLFNARVLLTFTFLHTYAYTTSCLLIRGLSNFYLVVPNT